jgi:hypothetical protein
MQKSEAIGELAKALSQLHGEIEDPIKNKQGNKSKYADLPQVLKTLRPLLNKNKLSFSQFPGEEDGKMTIETIIMHESGQWLSSFYKMTALDPIVSREGKVAMNKTQGEGGGITYARRYALLAAFAICGDDDTDANSSSANSNNKASSVQVETLLKLLNNDKDRIQKMMERLKLDNINNLTLDQYLTVTESINKQKAQGE